MTPAIIFALSEVNKHKDCRICYYGNKFSKNTHNFKNIIVVRTYVSHIFRPWKSLNTANDKRSLRLTKVCIFRKIALFRHAINDYNSDKQIQCLLPYMRLYACWTYF